MKSLNPSASARLMKPQLRISVSSKDANRENHHMIIINQMTTLKKSRQILKKPAKI
jgi:hypothetical protein